MSMFRDYVTSTAFALTISRRQIECIWQIENFGGAWVSLNTAQALISKGLVERKNGEGDDPSVGVVLTEAGKAAIPLLKLAGLWADRPAYLDEPAVELPEINVVVKPRNKEPQS